jgi:hypothetical protein
MDKHNQKIIDKLEELNRVTLEEIKQHNQNTLQVVRAQGSSIEDLHRLLSDQSEASEKTLCTTQSTYLIMTQIRMWSKPSSGL